jgi:putative peptidoglycan lipid II flippase
LNRLRTPTGTALIGTVLGNAPGFLLPFAVSWRLGAGELSDGYFFALGLALFGSAICNIVIEANSLPIMQGAKRYGAAALARSRRQLQWHAVVGAAVVYVVVALAGSLLILTRDWTADVRLWACVVTAISVAVVCIIAVNSVTAASLYAVGDFFGPTSTQSGRSLLPLLLVPFIPAQGWAIGVLAGAMLVGELLRAAVLERRTRVYWTASLKDQPVLHGDPPAVNLWSTAAPHALATIVANLAPVTDRVVASTLLAGSITVIDLGEKVIFVPLTALMSSIILVPGARWAAMAHTTSADGLLADFRSVCKRVAQFSVMCTVLMAGGALVAYWLPGDTFAGVPASTFTWILLWLSLGVPGAGLAATGSRFLTATRQTRLFPLFGGLILILNAAADLVAAHWFGVVGIALASTIVRCINAALFIFACHFVTTRTKVIGSL